MSQQEVIGNLVKQVAHQRDQIKLLAEGMTLVQKQVTMLVDHLKGSVPEVVESSVPPESAISLDSVDRSSS